MDTFLKKIKTLWRKIQSTDATVLACIVTGAVFALLAIIQIGILLFGGIHPAVDTVMLIIADLIVAVVFGARAVTRNKAVKKRRQAQGRRSPANHINTNIL